MPGNVPPVLTLPQPIRRLTKVSVGSVEAAAVPYQLPRIYFENRSFGIYTTVGLASLPSADASQGTAITRQTRNLSFSAMPPFLFSLKA